MEETRLEKGVSGEGNKFFYGSLIGVANGLFGGGGGMIAVPLLQKTGLSAKEAHATAILVILPISAVAFFIYAWRGYASTAVLLPTALGVIAGGDPMLKAAIGLAVESGKISTSLIQRKLSLGYGRSAKLIDRMQEMGIVSAPEGQKPRTVLITKEQFMEMSINNEIE